MMMKRILLGALVLLSACTVQKGEWELVWEENFDQASIDTATWTKIPRGTPEWKKYMSADERCYDMADGNLILKGIHNDDLETDTATYLTGGVYTKYKRAFYGGRLEVKAKLQGGKGVWPAIWLKPYEESKYKWPSGGEIDMMERLNHDTIVYQTVHSNYTHHLGIKTNPVHSGTAGIDPDGYNVYGVEMGPDSLVFYVNGKRNFAYPRIETDKEGQYPFDMPYYLLIDMQIGGGWVGKINPDDIPVEMKVDWVRYYKKRKE